MDQQRQSNLFSNNNEGYLHSLRSSRPVPKGSNPFNPTSTSIISTAKAKGHLNNEKDHMEALQTQKRLLFTPHKVDKDAGNDSKVTLNNFPVNFSQIPSQQVNMSLFLGIKPFVEQPEENKENSNLNSNKSQPHNQFSSSSNSFRHFSNSSKNDSEGVGGFKAPKQSNFLSNLKPGDNSFIMNLQPKFGSEDSRQNTNIFSHNRVLLNNPIISTLISNSSSASQSQGEINSSLNISKEEREEINVESNFNNGNDYNSINSNSNIFSLSPRLNNGYKNSTSVSTGLQTLNNQNNNFNTGYTNQIQLNNPFNNNPFTMNNIQGGYQSTSNSNTNGFNNFHNNNIDSNGLNQGMNGYQNADYSQQSLTESFMEKTNFYIPAERTNDEKFKLLALKNIRKPQFKDNRSISNADMTGVPRTNLQPNLNSNPFLQGTCELTLPATTVFNTNQYYKECFNSDDEPETMQQNPLYNQKKKKVAHSVKRHYMSTINFTESETGNKKSFYIYKDGERGFSHKWQQMIRPVTMDEDVPSDEDVISNGTRRNLDELMQACQLVMVQKRIDLVRNRDMITYK
jgi:hypothetical protein